VNELLPLQAKQAPRTRIRSKTHGVNAHERDLPGADRPEPARLAIPASVRTFPAIKGTMPITRVDPALCRRHPAQDGSPRRIKGNRFKPFSTVGDPGSKTRSSFEGVVARNPPKSASVRGGTCCTAG
jgi:hypothetical protein